MKEQLIEILGLAPVAPATEVTDSAVVSAVVELKRDAARIAEGSKLEKQISDKIVASGGALSREQALNVLRDQANARK